MAGSVSRELEDLLNPLPKFADPEDDDDEATKARVIERFAEEEEQGEEEEGGGDVSSLRKRNTSLLSDTDRRYAGKPVSRQQLLMELEGSGEEEDESEEDEGEDNDSGEDQDENEEMEEEDSIGADEEEDSVVDEETREQTEKEDEQEGITFPKRVDFQKLTEGMDDLGMSEEDDEDEESGSSDGEDEGSDDMEEEGGVQTFSRDKVDEEVEKGRAVKNQLTLWDQLLEGRIKMQKALMTANQLPQPDTLPEFKKRGGAELTGALKNTHKALKALQRSLLDLHDQLLIQHKDTRAIAEGIQSDEEEIDSDDGEEASVQKAEAPKRKLEMAEYPDFMAKRFATFELYRNTTLQKWHDKTRLTTGKSNKGFGAFDRNIVTLVEQVLMDKERLLRRTQTRRSEVKVLGKREVLTATSVPTEEEDAERQLKANQHLKDLDEDIFDDDDFYHQLLRELIERKTSVTDPNDQVAMGRQWLAIQKLRSKIKKKVDTKASKGRKVRFHIHSKLVNFMAPMDHSSMSDEARSELYKGLFGQNVAIRE